MEPVFPNTFDQRLPAIIIRGLAEVIPGIRAYLGRIPKPLVDSGYYTKTRENRPLIGPLPVEGAYVIGALSGFGIMAAPALGELLADHLTGGRFPHYAPAFRLERFSWTGDPKVLHSDLCGSGFYGLTLSRKYSLPSVLFFEWYNRLSLRTSIFLIAVVPWIAAQRTML